MKFVALSSSRGTTFRAVIDRMRDGSLDAKCLGLITDHEDRGCVDVAQDAGIPVAMVERRKGEEREAYDRRLQAAIENFVEGRRGKAEGRRQKGEGSDDVYLCALGWMYILSPWFVQRWERRIINVHPSLLPKYPGAHAIEDALKAGETETGMTIHFIDEGVDTGPILLQKSCPILPGDTVETLKERIQELEKEWYPKTLQSL